MNIIGVQLLLLFFGLFMVYVVYVHWRKKSMGGKVFGSWVALWLVFLVFTLFPKLLEPLIKELFIVRVMDLGMIGAFMVLTFITVENNLKISKYEKELEILVRRLAIGNAEKGLKKK